MIGHIVRLDTWVQRVTGVPMEPRTTTAEYDATTGHYTLYSGSGRGVVKLRLDLAHVLGVPEEQVRCVCQDMGGNFGTRNFFYPEYALLAWAARRVGRPVKWTCERSESFLSDYQGRDLTVEAELALDKEGNFLACVAWKPSNGPVICTSRGGSASNARQNVQSISSGCLCALTWATHRRATRRSTPPSS